ncbi:MAG TPA: hypoxanthine phosphoribosyltransferase [Thermoanaerobaculia bacterium]|nr:hypoxanthine phosphoribosyltransferase [Thermoanaerobaculia bacterium]
MHHSMRVLIPAAELSRRVAELAARIDADYSRAGGATGGPGTAASDPGSAATGPGTATSDPGRAASGPGRATSGGRQRPADDPLIAVGVLKGSVFFLADLLKRLRVPVAVDFLQTASYGEGGANRGELRIRKDLDLPIRGRDVLLVEDIVDTGYTVATILDLLRHRGARSVRLCALLDKAAARQVEVPIDYRGFAIENLFVVGYGLDHAERYRNLPHIAVWQPDGAPPALERSVSGMQFHHTDQAPAAIGPYSQAVSVDGWLYTSGQVGLDPATGELVPGGFEAQARRALENLRQVLSTAGCGFSDVVKATVYVVDLADFPRLNALYGEAMGDHRPARSTVQAAALPRGALVEIDLVARLPRAGGHG